MICGETTKQPCGTTLISGRFDHAQAFDDEDELSSLRAAAFSFHVRPKNRHRQPREGWWWGGWVGGGGGGGGGGHRPNTAGLSQNLFAYIFVCELGFAQGTVITLGKPGHEAPCHSQFAFPCQVGRASLSAAHYQPSPLSLVAYFACHIYYSTFFSLQKAPSTPACRHHGPTFRPVLSFCLACLIVCPHYSAVFGDGWGSKFLSVRTSSMTTLSANTGGRNKKSKFFVLMTIINPNKYSHCYQYPKASTLVFMLHVTNIQRQVR